MDAGKRELLYHYTDFTALDGILGHAELRLNNVLNMNDAAEMNLFMLSLARSIASTFEAEGDPDRSRLTLRIFALEQKNRFAYSAYAACFSRYRDDAAQWERYGGRGRGVCIAFDEALLSQMATGALSLESVLYQDNIPAHHLSDELHGIIARMDPAMQLNGLPETGMADDWNYTVQDIGLSPVRGSGFNRPGHISAGITKSGPLAAAGTLPGNGAAAGTLPGPKPQTGIARDMEMVHGSTGSTVEAARPDAAADSDMDMVQDITGTDPCMEKHREITTSGHGIEPVQYINSSDSCMEKLREITDPGHGMEITNSANETGLGIEIPLNTADTTKPPTPTVPDSLRDALNRAWAVSAVYKHPSFSSENEVRLLVSPFERGYFDVRPEYHISKDRIKKYYPLNLRKMCRAAGASMEDLVLELIIGPESTQSLPILQDYLSSLGLGTLADHISYSRCPLRSRSGL